MALALPILLVGENVSRRPALRVQAFELFSMV